MKHQHKNISRRLAAAMMAGAMMVSMVGMTAFAASTTTDSTSFTIIKNLTKEEKAMTPNASFEFTVDDVTVSGFELRNGIPVSSGVDGGVTVSASDASADFAPNGSLDDSTLLSDTITFDVHLNEFKGVPGIYKYQITENDVAYDGVTKDNNVLYLYVYIENDTVNGGVKVAHTELVDPDGDTDGGESKTDSFTNDYTTNDLILYKVLTGNAANMGETFTFNVKIDGAEGEQYYVEIGTYQAPAGGGAPVFTADGTTKVLTSGTPTEFTLGHNGAIKVYGLSAGDSYTIEEEGDNTNGYSLTINDATDDDGITTGSISEDSVIKYDNHKEVASPTGIAMTIAPYAIMVVAAAGVAFLFLRRRHSEF